MFGSCAQATEDAISDPVMSRAIAPSTEGESPAVGVAPEEAVDPGGFLLDTLVSLQAMKARLDAMTVVTARMLVAIVGDAALTDLAGRVGGPPTRVQAAHARVDAHAALADEIALATGTRPTAARDLVEFAAAPDARTAPLLDRLTAGATTWDHCRTVWTATADLTDVQAASVARVALAPVSGDRPASWATFRRRLHREICRHTTPEATRRRHHRDRRAALETWGDGLARLTFTGPAATLVGTYERLDTLARALKRAGDTRTLAQLRYDIGTGLVMYGQPTRHADSTDAQRDTSTTGDIRAGATGEASAGDDAAAFADTFDVAFPASPLPTARIDIVISAASLLGLTDDPGEARGEAHHGWLDAHTVRDVAHTRGSTWRRIVTDPVTGYAMSTISRSYAPPPRMAAAVRDRDGTCRFPGCTHPPTRADLDHVVEHPAGPTSGENLQALHRRHHTRKTTRLWRARMTRDGTVTWTTPLGRVHTTRPFDYRSDFGHPGADTPQETWHDPDPDPPPF